MPVSQDLERAENRVRLLALFLHKTYAAAGTATQRFEVLRYSLSHPLIRYMPYTVVVTLIPPPINSALYRGGIAISAVASPIGHLKIAICSEKAHEHKAVEINWFDGASGGQKRCLGE